MSAFAPSYIIGLDLGKKHDYTAMAVLNQTMPNDVTRSESAYQLIHLDRWRGRDYLEAIPEVRKVVNRLQQVAWERETDGTVSLVVDQTGVGEAVVESLRAAGLDCYGISIHGGENVSTMPGGWRVPKRELVGTAEVLLQSKRLQFADRLELANILRSELQSFKATIKITTGHVSYGADESWREGEHDDTVLALAMALWYGEYLADQELSTQALNHYYSRM